MLSIGVKNHKILNAIGNKSGHRIVKSIGIKSTPMSVMETRHNEHHEPEHVQHGQSLSERYENPMGLHQHNE
jgi:hypothetical protein